MNNRDSRDFRYTIMTFIFMGMFFWSNLQAWAVTDVRWTAIGLAAISAQIVLLNRMGQHDRLSEPIIVRTPVKRDTGQKEVEIKYTPQIQSHNGHRIRFGNFSLTKAQWGNLARVLENNQYHFVRDVVSQAGVFQSLSRRWQNIRGEFERLGWLADEDLTEEGIEWFNQFLDSTPPTPLAE